MRESWWQKSGTNFPFKSIWDLWAPKVKDEKWLRVSALWKETQTRLRPEEPGSTSRDDADEEDVIIGQSPVMRKNHPQQWDTSPRTSKRLEKTVGERTGSKLARNYFHLHIRKNATKQMEKKQTKNKSRWTKAMGVTKMVDRRQTESKQAQAE